MEGAVINTSATAALIGKQINNNVKDDEDGDGDDDDGMMIMGNDQVGHIGRPELHKLDAGAELLFVEEHLGQQQRQQEQQQREHGRGQPQQWGKQWRC